MSRPVSYGVASRDSRDSRDHSPDTASYAYYKSYTDYTQSRAAPSTSHNTRRTLTRSPSRARHIPEDDDRRRPRSFARQGEVRHGSYPEDEAVPRSQSTSRGAARAVVSPRAALGQYDTRTRRSPVPDATTLPRTYHTPRGRPPLPPGWIPQFSIPHGRWFYFNKATEQSQWEAPGFEQKAGRGMPGGGAVVRRKYAEPHRSDRGLGTTGLILGVAGGIAAVTLLAKAWHPKEPRIATSDSSLARKKSQSSFAN